MGSVKLKVPSYLLPSNVTFDPGSGELYLVQTASCESNDELARRLSRNTESSNSKLYKWQRKGSPWRKAIVVNKNPVFDAVSLDKANSIAERLSRPTKATLLRQNGDAESEYGYVTQSRLRSLSATSRTSATSKVSTQSLSKVPRPSARPDKPILIHPSSRKEKPESQSRFVRFQSPLPLLESVSRLSKTASSNRSGSTTPPLLGRVCNSPASEEKVRGPTTVERVNRSPSPARDKFNHSPSAARDKFNHSPAPVREKANQPLSPAREKIHNSPSPTREKRTNSPNRQDKSRDTSEEPIKASSSDNKNMELVLNYFSKLPGIEDE